MTDILASGQFVHVLRVSAATAQIAATRVTVMFRESDFANAQLAGTFVNVLRSTATNPVHVSGQFAHVLNSKSISLDVGEMTAQVLHKPDPALETAGVIVQVMHETPGTGRGRLNRAVSIITG